jgi:chromosome segregation ATPase
VFAGLYSNYLGKILERKNWYKRDNVAKKAGIADIECALDQADLCETNLDINLVELRGANEQLNSDMNHRNSELSSVKKELERLATGILMVNEDIKEITRAFEVTHQL